ncbi:MAG: cupin domain-containing protein [Ignavibacteriae bacterium HGW-Ignavibacteriae-3]|nr:MAG: cupin domain-containing protein [Ignavibacteriae bacterium HGW-Ignavibacteriae-3]
MENKFGMTGFIYNNDYEWEIVGEGVRRKILGYNKDLMLVIVEFKKGAIGYIHNHYHSQVSYLISGSFEVTIGSEKKIQKAGDVFFLESNIEHGVVAQEDSCLVDVFSPHREDFLKK